MKEVVALYRELVPSQYWAGVINYKDLRLFLFEAVAVVGFYLFCFAILYMQLSTDIFEILECILFYLSLLCS